MRYILLVLLCAFNLTANAQWWRGDFKKHKRYALITQPKNNPIKRIPKSSIAKVKLPFVKVPRSAYNLELCEKAVIKSAQHHMRYREYALASYNFSELAELYVKENRLSEAKWYYLQSILISKREGDQQHTISSLINLGLVKADLGDLVQAQQDLAEARQIAVATGRNADILTIDKKVAYVKSNKVWLSKSELRYAEAVELSGKIK
ncbi:hypothetical protein [Mucilaginibacter sp.]|uniref:hypothetical protein n=1 Tax=Mucilaginibacter sp. TaxID=1882438 RepID=UPI0032652DC1